MKKEKKVWAIIPARGGSTGIPRKNLQKVNGKPLLVHAIEQAEAASNIDRVIVSTEDPEIKKTAQRAGCETMGRVDEFIHDNSIQEVDRLLVWTVRQLEKKGEKIDIVVLLYPTAPLRRVATIEKTVSKVLDDNCDSSLTLYEDPTYLWRVKPDGSAEPVNYRPENRGPRQKEGWNQWGENKAVYAMTRDLLVETGCRLGGRIGWVEMARMESIDVDTPDDLKLCDLILKDNILKG